MIGESPLWGIAALRSGTTPGGLRFRLVLKGVICLNPLRETMAEGRPVEVSLSDQDGFADEY
jgi:hypothetical protein